MDRLRLSNIFTLTSLFYVPLTALFFIICPAFCHNACLADKGGIAPVFINLSQRLIHDGQDPAYIRSLFSRPEVRFDPRVMPRKLTHKEALLNYDRFLNPIRIFRARVYLRKNKKLLDKIQSEYGVPGEIKVAILLIETDLGRHLGSGLAFNILASMAAATDLKTVKPLLPPDFVTPQNAANIEKKLRKKSQWAYGELKALLAYCKQNHSDPLKIRGSIFGAIGLCQFMPSSALKYGVDFNHDGRVDLFQKADALASMANYLRSHGWKNNLDRSGKIKVLLSYNYSRPYADTVLKVAQKLTAR